MIGKKQIIEFERAIRSEVILISREYLEHQLSDSKYWPTHGIHTAPSKLRGTHDGLEIGCNIWGLEEPPIFGRLFLNAHYHNKRIVLEQLSKISKLLNDKTLNDIHFKLEFYNEDRIWFRYTYKE